jgi:hypothetical protein
MGPHGTIGHHNAVTVNGAIEAPVPEPDGWLVQDADSNQVSLDQLAAAGGQSSAPPPVLVHRGPSELQKPWSGGVWWARQGLNL